MTCEKKKTEPRVLLLIANPKLARKAAAMFDTARVPFQYQFHGLGTASSEIMETLGLGSIEKTILMCVLPRILAEHRHRRHRPPLRGVRETHQDVGGPDCRGNPLYADREEPFDHV